MHRTPIYAPDLAKIRNPKLNLKIMASSTIIATGDGQIPLFNWHIRMDMRTCVQLSGTQTIAVFIPAFFIPGNTGGTAGAGGDVASGLSQILGYVSNSSIAITPRLEAAQQVVDYLGLQRNSAYLRYNYIISNATDLKKNSNCGWSNSYFKNSRDQAFELGKELQIATTSWENIRNNLSDAQQNEIDNTELEIQLNNQIAELNAQMAYAKKVQDEARLKGLGIDLIRFGIPIAGALLISYLIFRKR